MTQIDFCDICDIDPGVCVIDVEWDWVCVCEKCKEGLIRQHHWCPEIVGLLYSFMQIRRLAFDQRGEA